MGNSLYMDIDRMCLTIKHGGEVDLHEVRTLLRRSQAAIEIIDSLSCYDIFNVQAKDVEQEREYHLQINATLTRQQVDDIMLYFSNHWDSLD